MRSSLYRSLLIVLTGIFCCQQLSAQTFNFSTTTEGSEIQQASDIVAHGFPDTMTVFSNDWHTIVTNPSTWRQTLKFKSINSFVKFYVNQKYANQIDSSYNYVLTYTMIGYPSPDTVHFQTVSNDSLAIGYRPDSLTAYQEIQLKKYSGFYKVKVILTGLYEVTGTPVSVNLSSLTNLNFTVEASILAQRYNTTNYGNISLSSLASSPSTTNNTLDITWANTIFPANYELEWTYVDNYSYNIATKVVSGAGTNYYDFRHNSTRVWLDTNFYRIPLVYPNGYIVYRVRVVQPDSLKFQYPIYSNWTNTSDYGVVPTSGGVYQVSAPYMSDNMNWQYTISFAEGGKYKHVLSFYDGLLKNRQSITRFNTLQNKLIVTENFYDHEGRPSIKTLPAPVSSSAFSFQSDVSVDSLTGHPYKASDYDSLITGLCPGETWLPPMALSAKARIYYSSQNSDTADYHKFVPDAEGYPLVQTIYEAGYTDRVEKQGGAGKRLQIADSNIIINDYVSPSQQELDMFFGTGIGYAGFYNKIVSQDPNRQYSHVIKDYHGKQMLTAMLGTGPDPTTHALVPVNNVPGVSYFSEDAIAGATQQIINNQKILDKDIFIDASGTDTIQYNYSFTPYYVAPGQYLTVKTTFKYELTDMCGNVKMVDTGSEGTNGVVSTGTPINYTTAVQTAYLVQGKYTLHKELTVNINDVIAAADSFKIHSAAQAFTPTNLRSAIAMDTLPCPPSDPTDTLTDCDKLKRQMMNELYPGARYAQYTIITPKPIEYFGIQKVNGNGTSDCVYPGNPFYGDSTINTGLSWFSDDTTNAKYLPPYYTVINNNSIFSIWTDDYSDDFAVDSGYYRYQEIAMIHLPDSVVSGGIIYHNLRRLDVDTFIHIFNDSIAAALLPLHPEYCQLLACYASNFVDTFKERITAIPDVKTAQALNALYLDSLIAYDPAKGLLSSSLHISDPSTALRTLAGTNISIDSFVLSLAYCSCTDTVMRDECTSVMFQKEIRSHLLINDMVKATYFKMMPTIYFENRDKYIEMMKAGLTPTNALASITTTGITWNQLGSSTLPHNYFPSIYDAARVTPGNMVPGSMIQADPSPFNPNGFDAQTSTSGPNWPRTIDSNYSLTYSISANADYDLEITEAVFDMKYSGNSGYQHAIASLYASKDGGPYYSLGATFKDTVQDYQYLYVNFSPIDVVCKAGHSMSFRLYMYTDTTGVNYSRHVYIRDMSFYGPSHSLSPLPGCPYTDARMYLSSDCDATTANPYPSLHRLFPTNFFNADGSVATGTLNSILGYGADTTTSGGITTLTGSIDASLYKDTTISPDSMTAANDSTIALYNRTQLTLCTSQIDTILDRLSNCFAGNATLLTKVKDTLNSICSRGQVQFGTFMPSQIQYALAVNGISMSDICNPYLVSYDNLDPTVSTGGPTDCKSGPFYSDLQNYLNQSTTISLLEAAAVSNVSSTASYTLNTSSSYESAIAARLGGATSVTELATYNSDNWLYTIYIYAGGDTVRVFLNDYHDQCDNFFTPLGDGDVISVSNVTCINNAGVLLSIGYVNDFAFAATVQHYYSGSTSQCTLTGWTDSVESLTYTGNTMAHSVPCTQMRSLYQQFMDTLAAYNIYGVDHPYYNTMLAHFMNFQLKQIFTQDQYNTFITSCALADSMLLPKYVAYSSIMLADSGSAAAFVAGLNTRDANVQFLNPYIEDSAGKKRVYVDFNQIPYEEYYVYKNYIQGYSSGVVYKAVNQPVSTRQASNEVGYVYTPTTVSFSPGDSSIFSGISTHLSFSGPATVNIWNTDHYRSVNKYILNSSSGIQPYEISEGVDRLQQFITARQLPTIFMSNYSNTIDGDYYKPEKTAYLQNVYRFQRFTPGIVLDSIAPGPLQADISLLSGDTVAYYEPYSTTLTPNLYIANKTQHCRAFDTLSTILNTVTASNSYSSPFLDQSVNAHSFHLTNNRALYYMVCSDGSYLYRYFGYKDTMYNVYLNMPSYIPIAQYKYYALQSVVSLPGDTSGRYFMANVQYDNGSLSGPVIPVTGMTDFKIANNKQLNNVILTGPITTSSVAAPDTANSCEQTTAQSDMSAGLFQSQSSYDSLGKAVQSGFLNAVMSSLNEQLNMGYIDQKFNYTLYYYDRAGNLMSTVPPQGVHKLTGDSLSHVDGLRDAGTSQLDPHSKQSFYYYNTLNEVVSQTTPDQGTTNFYYDAAGRLVFSQNSKQLSLGYYTYNLYDAQNRTVETGQLQLTGPGVTTIPSAVANSSGGSTASDQTSFVNGYSRSDVVRTIYDTAAKNLGLLNGLDSQANMRKRVSCVKFFTFLNSSDTYFKGYTYATHYSYDVDGNVKTLVQDFPALADVGQQYKRIDYDYDLISGKVNLLSYDRGNTDQMYQRYTYDADNRINMVESSDNGYIWARDASYSYYQHGPLARVSIGDLRVQGIDYAYTIQGWLKAVNSDTLATTHDMGQDGGAGSIYSTDVTAGTIDYFNGDYKSISGRQLSAIAPVARSLYNGNISRRNMDIQPFPRLSSQYVYDQLNRISTTTNSSIDAVTSTLTGLDDYKSNYKYDQDGNLLKLNRYGGKVGGSVSVMDSLTYVYANNNINNKLIDIQDSAADVSAYGSNDIPHYVTGGTSRYLYDNTGNLVTDNVSGQSSIDWNLYNKVTSTYNTAASFGMGFTYDGAGNRVSKQVSHPNDTGNSTTTEYYVHDAQGNILAVYNRTNQQHTVAGTGTSVSYANGAVLSNIGSTSFNHNFVVPVFSTNSTFTSHIITSAAANPTFSAAYASVPDMATYLDAHTSDYLTIVGIGGGLSYAYPLMQNDAALTLDTPVMAHAYYSDTMYKDNELSEGIYSGLFNTSNMDARVHVLQLMDSCFGPDFTMQLRMNLGLPPNHTPIPDPDNPLGQLTDIDATAELIYHSTTLPTFMAGYGIGTAQKWAFANSLATDTFIANDPYYWDKHVNEPYTSFGLGDGIQRLVAAQAVPPTNVIHGFLTGYSPAVTVYNGLFSPTTTLTTAYNAAPETFIDSFTTVVGQPAVDDAISAVGYSLSYYIGLLNTNLYGIASNTVLNALSSHVVQQYQTFNLAEHHLYGSSRLGIKKYWPLQVGGSWDYTHTPYLIDTIRMTQPMPWYSGEYQENIAAGQLNPYGNGDQVIGKTQHVIGQKEYELTDHLGDVLATVSDKRMSYGASQGSPISFYKAIIPAAYDYYPFGMLMPGRYTQDTATHTLRTTVSTMLPVYSYGLMDSNIPTPIGAGTVTVSGGIPQINAPSIGDGAYLTYTTPPGTTETFQLFMSLSSSFTRFKITVMGASDSIVYATFLVPTAMYCVVPVDIPSGTTVHINITGTATGTFTTLLDPEGYVLTNKQTSFAINITNKDLDKYRYGYNGKMKDNEWAGIGNSLDFKYRGYDSRIGRFRSVDPVAQHFPWNASYNYAENRVIDGIDLEGLEVMIVNEKMDATIYDIGVKNTGRSEIDVYAHGSPFWIGNNMPANSGERVSISSPDQFDSYMSAKSSQWRNRQNNGETVVVLHSCRTGRTIVSENGQTAPSIGQRISSRFHITVIAPDERDNFGSSEKGPYVDEGEDINGGHKDGKHHEATSKKGFWNVYRDGKLMESYKAGWTPKAHATWLDKKLYGRDVKDAPTSNNNSGEQPLVRILNLQNNLRVIMTRRVLLNSINFYKYSNYEEDIFFSINVNWRNTDRNNRIPLL